MHIKLCVDPVIPTERKEKNSAKNVDLYVFLADSRDPSLQHVLLLHEKTIL